jgi:uncharacterized protein with HEPN domain
MTTQQKFLADFINIANIHAKRLGAALAEVKKIIPLTASKFEHLDDYHIAFLDMLATRFSKLQDIIGSRIFPLILEILGEDATTFIDKLNKLEKIDYISSADWWMDLREIRNQMTHDYPDDYEILSDHFNSLVSKVEEILIYWRELKIKIGPLV